MTECRHCDDGVDCNQCGRLLIPAENVKELARCIVNDITSHDPHDVVGRYLSGEYWDRLVALANLDLTYTPTEYPKELTACDCDQGVKVLDLSMHAQDCVCRTPVRP